jgi:tRNA(fMet)-specific endonuclease VapC
LSARFMLDTDTVSYALRGAGDVAARLVEHSKSELCVSAITSAELRYGAARRKSAKLHHAINEFLRTVQVVRSMRHARRVTP